MHTTKVTSVLPFILPFFIFVGNGTLAEFTHSKSKQKIINPCPVETDLNETIINAFITSEKWQKGRQKTNTKHLTTSQIMLLRSPQYNSVCETFNAKFQEAFEAEWPDGLAKNDVTYYKVGNFFFVIISSNQPSASDEFVEGTTYITIFDENLNIVKGFFF